MELTNRQFPSPCGEKVGINKAATRAAFVALEQFPSPCGEKVGINAFSLSDNHSSCCTVSVPLRGKGRDQR